MMKKLFAMMAAVVLLVGVSCCAVDDNPVQIVLSPEEKALVGLWWDEFEYEDMTEDSIPFSRVLLAVDVEADHTGCLYLGVFDDTSDDPLVIYGGPDDAGFKWALLPDGRVQLSDPTTGESIALSRTRGTTDSGNYGKDMTDVSETNISYKGDIVTMSNSTYSGTLAKADAGKQSAVQNTLTISAKSADGTQGTYKDRDDMKRECIVVTINGKKYAVATTNEEVNATFSLGNALYYSWPDACLFFGGRRTNGTYTLANVWRLPTNEEALAFGKLNNSGKTTKSKRKRTWFIGKAKLDLPIEGGYYGPEGHIGEKRGFYWTSTPASSSDESMALNFNAEEGYQECRTRAYANQIDFSVRLFCKLPKQ